MKPYDSFKKRDIWLIAAIVVGFLISGELAITAKSVMILIFVNNVFIRVWIKNMGIVLIV